MLRQQREIPGIRLTDAAQVLEVPHQRLPRLKIGYRTDPDLTHRCQAWLDEVRSQAQPIAA